MFERCTDRARRVLVLAQEEARLGRRNFVGTEHILLGLIHEGEGVAAKALGSLGISLAAVREKVEGIVGPPGEATAQGSPPFTPRAKEVLGLSLREALQLGHNYIGTEHLLLGLVLEGGDVGAQALVALGVDLSEVRRRVLGLLTGYATRDRGVAAGSPAPPGGDVGSEVQTREELAVAVLRNGWSGTARDLALSVLAESAPEPPEFVVHYAYRLKHRRGCPEAELFIDRGACVLCAAELAEGSPPVTRLVVNGVELPADEPPAQQ